jgi:hypothetical protein
MTTTPRPSPAEIARAGTPWRPADVAVGVATVAAGTAILLARRTGPIAAPVVRVALRPPLAPARLQPARWLESLGHVGADERAAAWREAVRVLDALVPMVVDALLRRVDLNAVLTRYLDLDAVVAQLDLDAAATRLDIDKIARRVDPEVVLDRIELTELILRRVDLDVLVNAILDRIDLVGLAEGVIDAVDLPEIIRESTGSMASDTVRGARMQGIAADEAVDRVRSRLLRRGPHPSP